MNRIEIPKLDWVQFYIGLAFAVSQKSPDAQTKHGCVITDQQNRPLSFGYNGFPRGVDDSDIPNIRPQKYKWCFHSECNAVANCEHRPENGIAYVTGQCCNNCIYTLWQHGVKTVYIADRYGSQEKGKMDKEWFDKFIDKTKMNIRYVKPDLSWLKNIGNIVAADDFYGV